MRLTVVLMVFWLGFSVWARAGDVHYQDYIIGDQAVGLGGAYTAIGADPSGMWYNPAGMVDVHKTSLSLSANLYGIQDSSVGKEELVFPEDPISKIVAVPSSAGFVQTFGRLDMRGRRPYAFGTSIAVPYYRKSSTAEEGTSQDPVLGPYRHGYHRVFEDQTLWLAAGAAMRLSDRISIGAGVALAHRSVQDAASNFIASDLVNGEFRSFRSAMMDMNFSNDSLMLVGGIKFRVLNNLYLGAMVRSPSVTVYSKGSLRFARSRSDGNGDVGFLPTPDEVQVKSESKINGEARMGLAYFIGDFLTLSADLSLYLPVDYTLVNLEDKQASSALLIPTTVERKLTINGNLGAEYKFLGRYSIGLGAFSNFASSPQIPNENVTRPTPARVNMFGGSFAFGLSSEHSLTRLGFAFSRGTGEDVIAVNNPGQLALEAQDYARVEITQTFFYFFLASTFMY